MVIAISTSPLKGCCVKTSNLTAPKTETFLSCEHQNRRFKKHCYSTFNGSFKGCHLEMSTFQGLPVLGGSISSIIWQNMTTSLFVVTWLIGFEVTWLQHFQCLHSRVATYKPQIFKGCLDSRGRVCSWQPQKGRHFEGATFKTEGSSYKVSVLSMVLFKGCHWEKSTF